MENEYFITFLSVILFINLFITAANTLSWNSDKGSTSGLSFPAVQDKRSSSSQSTSAKVKQVVSPSKPATQDVDLKGEPLIQHLPQDLPLHYPSTLVLPQVPPGNLGDEKFFKNLIFANKPPITPCWILRVIKYAFPAWKAVPASGFRYCLGAQSAKFKVEKADVEAALVWMTIGPKPLLYHGKLSNSNLWVSCTPWAVQIMQQTEGPTAVSSKDGHSKSFSRRRIPDEFSPILEVCVNL
jgi:hypothetical protein